MTRTALLILLGLALVAVGCEKSVTDPTAEDAADQAKRKAAEITGPSDSPEAPEVTPPADEEKVKPIKVVYLDIPRDAAWFDAMFERYNDKIALVGDTFYDIGDDKVLPPPIQNATPGDWGEVHDAEVKEVRDPIGYTVLVRKHAYRMSDQVALDELPEEGPFPIILDDDSEERMRGDKFEEDVVCIKARHFILYKPLTREQFAKALADGFTLVRYELKPDGTIDKSYEK